MSRWIVLLSLLALAGGCGEKPKTVQLKPQAFQNPPAAPTSPPKPESPPHGGAMGGAASADAQPAPAGATSAGHASLAAPANPVSSGAYMVVGTVVAEVNGRAIYADKVLAKLDTVLTTKAGELSAQEFREFARTIVRNQVEEEIRDELEFAAAQRNTTVEEQELAAMLTTIWRQREITRAGGSLAVTRWQWMEREKVDFDEKVEEQYRRHLIQIYYHKYVWNRVQVSADDMRRYYDLHVNDMFTDKSAVRFRVIKVSANLTGGREAALKKAQDIQEKIRQGNDFATLARTRNDDPVSRKNAGFLDMVSEPQADGTTVRVARWYEPDSLTFEAGEKAIFALNEKEVTDILEEVQDRDVVFWIAKLEEKQQGRVHPFESEAVQQRILEDLRSQQRRALRKREHDRLLNASVVREDPKLIETAVDMAMQKYATHARSE